MSTHRIFKPADDDFQVGDQVTILGWSDRYAYTVIARTPATMTLQRNKVIWHKGQVSTEPDPDGITRVARITTRRGVTGWRSDGAKVVAGAHEYRDPSF